MTSTYMTTNIQIFLSYIAQFFLEKSWKENQNIFCIQKILFRKSCCSWHFSLMWKNTVQPDRPQMIIWCKRISCWIIKAKQTHTQNMWYLLLLNCINSCMSSPQSYVLHALLIFSCLIICSLLMSSKSRQHNLHVWKNTYFHWNKHLKVPYL
jgi:hypothetical protein